MCTYSMRVCMNAFLRTSMQDLQRFQQAPAESVERVLDAGAQAECALQVRLAEQKVSVGLHLRSPAQQRCHIMHKLRDQAGVRVVGLTVMVRHHLQQRGRST